MHKRAYRPEVADFLETRKLLSAAATRTAEPYPYSRRLFTFTAEHIRLGFYLYNQYRDIDQLHAEISDVAVHVPFQKADNLGPRIETILDRMQESIAGHVRNAVRSAQNEVVALIRTDVMAHVKAGEVVIR